MTTRTISVMIFGKAALQRPQGGRHASIFPRIPDLPCGACHDGVVRACRLGRDLASRPGSAVRWTFTPVDVGIETGQFAKQGLIVEPSAFGGDAKLQQALTADGVDIGIGSGPGMAFMAKGAPVKAVAAMAGIPRNI